MWSKSYGGRGLQHHRQYEASSQAAGGLLLWKTLGLLIKKSLIRAIQERLKIREVVLAHGPVDSIEPDYLAVLPYWMGKRVPAILRFSVEDIQTPSISM